MTNEEFQKIVLEEFQKLNEKVGNLDGKVDNLEQGQKSLQDDVSGLKEGQKNLEGEVKGIKKVLREIKRDQKFMWGDIKRIDNRLAKQEGQIKFLHREL